MALELTEQAKAAVANTNPRQIWAFVCDSRRKDAKVVDAHIGFEAARSAARKMGGCMRVGYVAGELAVIIRK